MTDIDYARMAAKIRQRFVPPMPSMTPGEFMSAECLQALVGALDEMAREDEVGRD